MEAAWRQIDEFPNYSVSPQGRVINNSTYRELRHSFVQYGTPTVGLNYKGIVYRRSVSLLVARAWLAEPQRYDFTTPIHLDANRANCNVENLMWRPRWFAIQFHKERKNSPFPKWKKDFVIIETQEVFRQPYDCAGVHGILEWDVYRSIYDKRPIFPQWLNASFFD